MKTQYSFSDLSNDPGRQMFHHVTTKYDPPDYFLSATVADLTTDNSKWASESADAKTLPISNKAACWYSYAVFNEQAGELGAEGRPGVAIKAMIRKTAQLLGIESDLDAIDARRTEVSKEASKVENFPVRNQLEAQAALMFLGTELDSPSYTSVTSRRELADKLSAYYPEHPDVTAVLGSRGCYDGKKLGRRLVTTKSATEIGRKVLDETAKAVYHQRGETLQKAACSIADTIQPYLPKGSVAPERFIQVNDTRTEPLFFADGTTISKSAAVQLPVFRQIARRYYAEPTIGQPTYSKTAGDFKTGDVEAVLADLHEDAVLYQPVRNLSALGV